MKIARVVGNVVSTIKCPSHNGLKLMIIELIDIRGKICSDRQIAVDEACAGVGDIVLLTDDGGAARMITGDNSAVIDWVIAGVLDKLEVE